MPLTSAILTKAMRRYELDERYEGVRDSGYVMLSSCGNIMVSMPNREVLVLPGGYCLAAR